jgi:hypothetical protein
MAPAEAPAGSSSTHTLCQSGQLCQTTDRWRLNCSCWTLMAFVECSTRPSLLLATTPATAGLLQLILS